MSSNGIIDDIEAAYRKLIAERVIDYVHSQFHWPNLSKIVKKRIRLGLQ